MSLVLDTAATVDDQHLTSLQASWKKLLANSADPPKSANPQFRALATQSATADLEFAAQYGSWMDQAHESIIGTVGGRASIDIQLAQPGCDAFFNAFKTGKFTSAPGAIYISYMYMRTLPQCSVTVTINGQKLFNSFSGSLDVTAGNTFGWR